MKLDFEEQSIQLDQWIDYKVDINHQLQSAPIAVPIKPDNRNSDILSLKISLYAVLLRYKTEMLPDNADMSTKRRILDGFFICMIRIEPHKNRNPFHNMDMVIVVAVHQLLQRLVFHELTFQSVFCICYLRRH